MNPNQTTHFEASLMEKRANYQELEWRFWIKNVLLNDFGKYAG